MATNNRASFLDNLRTGGVRSSSSIVPQTAAPNVTSFQRVDLPMSAAINGSFHPSHAQVQAQLQVQAQAQAQAQLLQVHMMHMEIMRLQAIQQAQAQQYQLEIARQQQHQQHHLTRRASQYVEPVTAGPAPVTFPRTRPSQAEQLKAQLHLNTKNASDAVPMTAALGGKFGGRLNPNAASFQFGNANDDPSYFRAGVEVLSRAPSMSNNTIVVSGGAQLGLGAAVTPSKSDASLNWRSNANFSGHSVTPVNVKITPPPSEGSSPSTPVVAPPSRSRPQPLQFDSSAKVPFPLVTIDVSDAETSDEVEDTSSSSSNKSDSSPPTPRTSSSTGSASMSLREEASKRLYEGLGIGRPAPQTAQILINGINALTNANDAAIPVPASATATTFMAARMNSQPLRQPRGPPSGTDELGPKNFAARIRRRAISGLEAMMDANIARREIEAF